MATYRIERLGPANTHAARRLFSAMAEVFEESTEELSDVYLARLLARDDLWILAAMSGDELAGGLTAHTLPMTRSESREIFIYDLAVRTEHRRLGVGRLLVSHLRRLAGEAGVDDIFVPADDDDLHAIEFYRAVGGVPSRVTFFTFGRT